MDFFCQSVPNTDPMGLCVPVSNKETSFYVVTPPATDPSSASEEIKRKFKTDSSEFSPVTSSKGESNAGPNARFFDVTKLVPEFIRKHIFNTEKFPGPNCYFAALSASGVLQNELRYVDDLEFSFYLTRDFQAASPAEALVMGAVIAFRSSPTYFGFENTNPAKVAPIAAKQFCRKQKSPHCLQTGGSHLPVKPTAKKGFAAGMDTAQLTPLYNSGEHVAFSLPSGFIFHKLTWRWNARYEVVPFEEATKNLDYSVWSNLDRFERSRTVNYAKYYPSFYIKRTTPIHLPAPIQIPEEQKRSMMILFNFYISLLEGTAELNSSDKFNEKRPNLLSIENAWNVCKKFEDEVIRSTPSNLLLIDKELAETYLKLRSLNWQYEAIKDGFAPKDYGNVFDTKRYAQELYKAHYLGDLEAFKVEVSVNLTALGIPQDSHQKYFNLIMEKITPRLPTILESATLGVTIDFFKLLKEITR